MASENVSYVGYIYKLTNTINNKIYIGKRQKPKFDKNYWGSGVLLSAAYKKYGKDNFTRAVLDWCNTSDELIEKEKYWISFYESTNPDIGYNLTAGGDGASSGELNPNYGSHTNHWTEESRKKQSEHMTGVKKSEEHKRKIGQSHKGKKVSSDTCQKLKNSWCYEKHFNPKSLAAMSKSRKGKKFSEQHKNNLSESIKMYHKNNPKIWITNGKENKLISEGELLNYSVSWYRGRTIYKSKKEEK